MEREKCGTTCHIRGQTCSLTTRSLTEFYYIHKITNTCLPNYSERRSGKSWELVTLSLHQSSDVALDIEKLLKYKENHLSLCVNRSTFFFFFWNKNCLSGDPPGSLAFPIVLTTKKTVVVIKTIVKPINPEGEV